MDKSMQLQDVLAKAVAAGGGVHSSSELAFMLNQAPSHKFNKFLADCAKRGSLRRVARNLYESVITPPDPITAPYKIIKKMRPGVLTYVSLESQLSHTGHISQIVMDHFTLITKGRGGLFTTPYGTLEFIHTKKPISSIMPRLYFDPTIAMLRAQPEQAIADLKACRRNLHLLEELT